MKPGYTPHDTLKQVTLDLARKAIFQSDHDHKVSEILEFVWRSAYHEGMVDGQRLERALLRANGLLKEVPSPAEPPQA